MNRRVVLIGFGAAGALLVLWFLLLWGPQGGRLDDAEERRAAAESENSALEIRLARLEEAQGRAPQLLADLEALRAAVPDDPGLAQFILDANEIAERAGVDFLSISPGVPSPSLTGGPPVISLQITVNGGYFAVLDYLDRLDGLSRIVVVDSLNLTPANVNGQIELGVQLTARMFSSTLLSTGDGSTAPVPVSSTTATTAPPSSGASTTTTIATTTTSGATDG
jgi:Tfp pilus assembly protein PilO